MTKDTKPPPKKQRSDPIREQEPEFKVLNLGDIRLDGDTQPRVELDKELIAEYAELYRRHPKGSLLPCPTVVFDGRDYWLVDGFHRRSAAHDAGRTQLLCDVRKGSLGEARWFSYSVNKTHGLRRTNGDKVTAVKRALQHPNAKRLSDARIAEHVGVSDRMVAKYRTPKDSESTERVGRDGRTINVARIGKASSPTASCPTCGSLERDADGDCAECHEPAKYIEAAKAVENVSHGTQGDQPVSDPADDPPQVQPADTSQEPVKLSADVLLALRRFQQAVQQQLIELSPHIENIPGALDHPVLKPVYAINAECEQLDFALKIREYANQEDEA